VRGLVFRRLRLLGLRFGGGLASLGWRFAFLVSLVAVGILVRIEFVRARHAAGLRRGGVVHVEPVAAVAAALGLGLALALDLLRLLLGPMAMFSAHGWLPDARTGGQGRASSMA